MTHRDFPLIVYPRNKSPLERGRLHGEDYREGVRELAAIRRELMVAKNPRIKDAIGDLARRQIDASRRYDPRLCEELQGIAEGADILPEDVVVLNNYTDFRDLEMPEEGCSTVHVQRGGRVVSGQTWDMHASAKDFVCLIDVPPEEGCPGGIFFSLVGCLGMMGVSTARCLLGVNNINTKNAECAVIWPMVVRRLLQETNLRAMEVRLQESPLTSGHNYLLSDAQSGLHMEAAPAAKEIVSSVVAGEEGAIFHTNHCLGKTLRAIETPRAVSSTSHDRYRLLEKKLPSVGDFQGLVSLLKDHDNHPKSICSHFESGLQDPSMTCGGGVSELTGERTIFWRGCAEYDDNFKQYSFIFEEEGFTRSH